jgi:hypothetical protein
VYWASGVDPLYVCWRSGWDDVTRYWRDITMGRVDGLTCQLNVPEGPTTIVVSSVSGMRPAHVGVAKLFLSRRVVPGTASPVTTEWVAGLTAFSSAIRKASRLPLPA